MNRFILGAVCMTLLATEPASATTPVAPMAADTVYRTLLLRAAPGSLDAMLDLYRGRRDIMAAAGLEVPVLMRHSQGDHWDLMALFPIGSMEDYFGAERASRLDEAGVAAGLSEAAFQDSLRSLAVFREEVFVSGPPVEVLREQEESAGLFHIEMFVAVPGRYYELVGQRHMENAYYHATDRAGNLVFERLAGAQWDVFTVGFYDDMQHFAADPESPREVLEQAAVDAGFESRSTIGTYLRELMHHHNDTLAVPVS